MNEAPAGHHKKSPHLIRIVRARPRLFLSATLGLVIIAVTYGRFGLTTRLLIGWDIGVALYLGLALHLMTGAHVHHIRRHAIEQDEGRFTILMLTVAAALASLAAILAELANPSGGAAARQPGQLVLATITILLSWTLIQTIFALHYAHEFYDETMARGRGLAFPGGENEPDYWDFMYFSFVIGMTSQVSDVGVTSKQVRRTVAAHGIVSFLFNAALLALTVNIAASMI